MSKYFKNLVGEKCYLSPLSTEDAHLYTEWLNDYYITLNLGGVGQMLSLEVEKKILEGFQECNNYIFAIVDRESNKLIGSCGLHDVNFINGTAEVGINIGDKNYWNRSYGLDSMNLLLDFAFNVLNIYTAYLTVLGFNKRAQKLFTKVGFENSGTLKSFRKIAGNRYDVNYMQIFAENFKSPYINKVLNDVQSDKGSLDLKLEL
ncbi:MAG: GNAT family protein [Candidatus Cloacimonadales bacterium]|jgi:RimJ/RimL family protein N-acetyltransferase|nr:GNAT family N-acetyltransferase [Candidatus Cloacimonadota bacterium]MDD2649664.1 GNAT family protein [Candidatus Cloacimonadota bacterium]MDD3501163.1 GNAT family protein [Candidatus Cloacimonadota bacterium]MDX9976931.1 GNAT family protein [Candidatus Cloacimonadales bacterium]